MPGAEAAALPLGGQSLWAGRKHIQGHLPILLHEKRLDNASYVVLGISQASPYAQLFCVLAQWPEPCVRQQGERPEAQRGGRRPVQVNCVCGVVSGAI